MTEGTGTSGAGGGGDPVIRVTVDRERCMGSGNCLFWAPGTFDLDDDGVAIVIDPAGDEADRITVAVEGCPTRAISVARGE
jgi:ferredoxin